jgi:hypothetical protein
MQPARRQAWRERRNFPASYSRRICKRHLRGPIGGTRVVPEPMGRPMRDTAEGAMTSSEGWVSRRANLDDNWANSAVIATSFAAIIAVLFIASRRGLASQANELIAAGICLAAVIGAIRLSNCVRLFGLTCREQEAIFTIGVFSIIAGAIVLRVTAGVILVLIIALSYGSLRYARNNRLLLAIIFGASSGFSVFIWTNAWNYASVWLYELTLLGVGSKDSLFHSTISAMIRNYSIASTGLSGLAPIKYYTGSHAVMAGLSSLADVAPILIYPAGQQILLEPALVFSIAYSTSIFASESNIKNTLIIPMIAISFILLSSAVTWNSYVASESYCLSLIILFLCVPHLFSPLWLRCAPKSFTRSKWVIISALYLVALLLIKTSVAIVGTILIGLTAGFGLIGHRPIVFIFLCVGGLLAMLGVIVATSYVTGIYEIIPLSFLRQYPQECLAEVLVVLFGVAALTQEARSIGFSEPWAAIMIWSTAAFASFLPGFVIDIPAGSAAYFSGPIVFLSCIPISIYLGRRANSFTLRAAKDSTETVITALLVGALIVIFAADIRPVGKAREFISRSKILHALGPETSLQSIISPPPQDPGRFWLLDLGPALAPFDEKFKMFLATTPLAQLQKNILKLTFPRWKTLIFVPPAMTELWSLHPDCAAAAFMLPALTGLPMLDGLPPLKLGCKLENYGYSDYAMSDRSHDVTDFDLCREVRSKGFSAVIKAEARPTILGCSEYSKQ